MTTTATAAAATVTVLVLLWPFVRPFLGADDGDGDDPLEALPGPERESFWSGA